MSSYLSRSEASDLLLKLSDEFALLRNPEYVHPPYELAPLAPRQTTAAGNIRAAVMDMDGTTTTTEELCLHSLEYMLREMSGRRTKAQWSGLDHARDYPHIIGNSTTKHVEYLIRTYRSSLRDEEIKRSFLYAAAWTLLTSKDRKRREEVALNITNFHCRELLEDPRIRAMLGPDGAMPGDRAPLVSYLMESYGGRFSASRTIDLAKMGIDIYYQRYHEILERIRMGESGRVSAEIFDDPDRHMIHPMPGVLIFLALLRGWLGEEAGNCLPELLHGFEVKSGRKLPAANLDDLRSRLCALGKHFEKKPARVAIVTSSIFYEADIVMTEVCTVLKSQIEGLPLSESRRQLLRRNMTGYRNIYSAFVTASDSSEIRLKPHRDLYSMALHQLDVHMEEFGAVIGFEDSESGTIALRAAGIGLCVAVPFSQTSGHNLEAAAHVCHGGLPEAILLHNVFMKRER